MNEQWEAIPGYGKAYQASSKGQIRSLDRLDSIGRYIKGRVIKPKVDRNGYLSISLCHNGRVTHERVHRLVAKAYIENSGNRPQVNHINGVKSDNREENLEWVTATENQQHSYRVLGTKPWSLGKKGIKSPRSKPVLATHLHTSRVQTFGSALEAGRKLNIHSPGVSKAARGELSQSAGYRWRYISRAQYHREAAELIPMLDALSELITKTKNRLK